MKDKKRLGLIILGVLFLGVVAGVYFWGEEDINGFIRPDADAGEHAQVVVSAHGLATEAGFEMLDKGGTAADASVAVAAVLSVVEPHFSNALGGGTWSLYFDADEGEVTSLDGVGTTGSNASASDYRNRASQPGIHQAIVPGAWDGWMLWLDEYGELGLDEVLAPAIDAAENGFEMSEDVEFWLNSQEDSVLAQPAAARVYAPNGELLSAGDTVRNEDFASTLQALADAYQTASEEDDRSSGIQAARDYYYRGPIAESIVEASDGGNGYLVASDFADFSAEIVEPIRSEYRGLDVYQNPPNSQGIAMLLGLNILEGYELSDLDIDSAEAVHLQTEAIKLAYGDRFHHVTDPAAEDVPVDDLLSSAHAERQRQRIDTEQALSWPIADELVPGSADEAVNNTTTFHVADKYGNTAATTTSIGARFWLVGDTGIHINERMKFFNTSGEGANQVRPGYKVRHTSSPYLVLREGKPYILGGNIGVDTQPQAQMQQLISMVDFGLSPQDAVDRPRFISTAFPDGRHPNAVANTLQLEDGFSRSMRNALGEKGHDLRVGEGIFGTAAIIRIDEDGSEATFGADTTRNPEARGGVVPAE